MSKTSCLRCDRYLACKDLRKSIIFVCDRYKETKQSQHDEKVRLEDLMDAPFVMSTVHVPIVDPHDDSSFNAFETIKGMIKDQRMVSPDIKIPEGDFPEAPNFYQWCVSDQYLDQKPFVMQALIGTQLFGEFCPNCSDTDWMENEVSATSSLGKFEEKVALLEYGKCPSCEGTRLEFYRSGLLHPYWELALSAGQRSGKSALFGMMASYLTHRLIKMEKPNEVLGLLKANVLQGTFVALTFAQAKDTLWEPFYGHLLEAPWFKNYHAMLNEIQQHHGEEEIYKLKDTFVYYRHRRIQVYPAAPDKRVLRGRTRFVAGVDELGWFDNSLESAKNIKMNANEVYIALERSLLTVRSKASQIVKQGFYNVPFGYFINISSPSSSRDKIMELVRKSQGSRRMLGLTKPTWQMNPHVPRSALNEEFRKDPDAAMRDYGAQPPLTNSPFISSIERIENCYSKTLHQLQLAFKTVRSRDKTSSELYAELDFINESGKPSVLALDAGHSNNSFAFAIGHRAKNGYPVISVVGEIIPTPGIRINHSLVYSNILTDLIGVRNVVLVCADRWNSLKVLADAEQDFGIEKRQYSLKYDDMQLFKSHIDDRQLMLPRPKLSVKDILKYDHSKYPQCFKNKPAEHLTLQLLTVQDTGTQVIKGEQLTDDVLRAAMLCFRMLVDEQYDEILNAPDEEVVSRIDITTMAFARNYSTGGGGSSMGGGNSGSSMGVLKQRQ